LRRSQAVHEVVDVPLTVRRAGQQEQELGGVDIRDVVLDERP
jgi:hypothetical protein